MRRDLAVLFFGAALACANGLRLAPPKHAPPASLRPTQRSSALAMREYSTMVKITAETKAPLRQARIFFLYPATLAGASIAAYVSLTRIIAAAGGFRTDLTPLSDAGNLAIDLGVVAAAVWALRNDLKGRAETLEKVALELEGPVEPNAKPGGTTKSGRS